MIISVITFISTCCRQENGTVRITGNITCNSITANTILFRPGPCTVIYEFLKFDISRHTPVCSPPCMCHIIFRLKNSYIILIFSFAIFAVIAIFCQDIIIIRPPDIIKTIFIFIPIIMVRLFYISPLIIVSIFLRLRRPHITGCPFYR